MIASTTVFKRLRRPVARISPATKLTISYVLILAVLCIAFSVVLYSFADRQLVDGLIRQYRDLIGPPTFTGGSAPAGGARPIPSEILPLVEEARRNLIMRLVYFNAVILAVGSALSLWLARRTMQPIEAALEAQSRFTADASHELRTPLAVMQTEIEIARADPKLSRAQALELLDSNLEEVGRLRSLADGLLRLSRSEAEPIELAAISTGEVAAQAAAAAAGLARAAGITVVNDTRGLPATGDRQSLVELIGILLDNAIKYSPGGTTVTVADRRDKTHVHFEVRDQGYGIATEDVPHIFKRFYRSDKSRTSHVVEGHGLGLSLAQKIADINGARLTVASRVGEGSTFTVRLRAVS